MTNRTLRRVLPSAWIFLSFTVLAACASGASASPGAPASAGTSASPGASASSPSPGYTGYTWRVVAVSHDGKVTPIPARYSVTMQFSPGGQFVASDGIHAYSGKYRAANDAFTTSVLAVTANGYMGNDPILLLTISAMDSLGNPATYPVRLTSDRLAVDIGSYTLTFDRAGRLAQGPTPTGTG